MRDFLKTVLLAAACLAIPPAHAEDEIVVTATRTATSIERLPGRNESIDRADVETKNMTTLPEALGAQAVQTGGIGQQASLFLRGANSKHALALLDGVRLNDASNPTGQYDFGQDTLGGLQRVEVLRGPASSLYGSDAIGGVVNMIPRRGGERPFAPFAELSVGAFETRRVLLGAAGTGGGVEYGISAESLQTDGYDLVPARMSTHTGDRDGAALSTLTASVRRESGALAFDALLRARDATAAFDTFSGGAFFDLRADDPDLENDSAQLLWRLGGEVDAHDALNLRLAAGQVRSERTERDGAAQTSAADSRRDFVELTSKYDFAGGYINSGFVFERDRIDTAPQFAAPLSIAEDRAGAYALAHFDIGARVAATGSVRIDDYESFGARATYSLGAVADLAPLRLFASVGSAFKAPSLSERYELSFFNLGNADLSPERSRSWEIGADWAAAQNLEFGVSFYRSRIDDLIEYDFTQRRNLNVGRAEIDGAEVFAEAKLAPRASLRVAYFWTDARNEVSAQLARRPLHSWRLDAVVSPYERVDLSLSWSLVGKRADVTYDDGGQFESASGHARPFNIGAFTANFILTDQVRIFARLDNVTDATYEQPSAFAGAPRNLALGLRAVF